MVWGLCCCGVGGHLRALADLVVKLVNRVHRLTVKKVDIQIKNKRPEVMLTRSIAQRLISEMRSSQ